MNTKFRVSILFFIFFAFSCSNDEVYEINEDGVELELDFSEAFKHLEENSDENDTENLETFFKKPEEELRAMDKEDLLKMIDGNIVSSGSVGLTGTEYVKNDAAFYALFGKLDYKDQIELLETGSPAQKFYAFKMLAINNRAKALELLEDIVCHTSQVTYLHGCTSECTTLGQSYVEAFLDLGYLCNDEYLKLKLLKEKSSKNKDCNSFSLQNYQLTTLPNCL